jgi:hypothetical protein
MATVTTADHKLQRNGLIFKAISGFKTCRLILSPKGVPELTTPNRLLFTTALDTRLEQAAQSYWHPQPEVPFPAKPAWVLNTCADADSFSEALLALDAAYPTAPPIFNHPRAVMAVRRDIAGLALTGIPGLEVPRCRRFMAHSPRSFTDCFEQGGFQYPVTVQPTTSRNGADRVWIAHPLDWQTAFNKGGGGRQHIMVQAHPDEAAADWALRMVFVGRSGTVESMRHNASERLADPVVPAAKPLVQSVFKAAMGRIPLDFWTLDVVVLAPDRLRLLDVSAGLHVPAETDNIPEMRRLCLGIMAHLVPRLSALLAQPQTWREDARKLPGVAELKKRYGA